MYQKFTPCILVNMDFGFGQLAVQWGCGSTINMTKVSKYKLGKYLKGNISCILWVKMGHAD